MNDNKSGLGEALAAARLVSGDDSQRPRAQVREQAFLRSACRRSLRRADRQALAFRSDRRARRSGARSNFPVSCRQLEISPPRKVCCKARRPGWKSTRVFLFRPFCAASNRVRISVRPCCCRNPKSQALLPKFIKDGRIELPGASIERRGKAAILTYRIRASSMPRIRPRSTAWRPASISPCSTRRSRSRCCAAMKVEHPKYMDRHVFGAGINLTHLYHGRIPFLWYLERDLGYVNKLYRGLALADDAPPDEFGGATPSRNRGSRRWSPSPSAVTASFCWRSITCWRRRPRS